MKTLALGLATTAAIAVIAAPASAAVSVTYSLDTAGYAASYLTDDAFHIDFDTLPEARWSGSTANTPAQAVTAQPADSVGNWATVSLTPNFPVTWQTLDLTGLGPISSISFILGSVDDYNRILVNGIDNPFSGGRTGAQLTSNAIANDHTTSVVLTFTFTDESQNNVTGLSFRSIGQNALEFDSVKIAAVPEPATWAMMIGGFGLIGLSMRRRRRARVAVSFS